MNLELLPKRFQNIGKSGCPCTCECPATVDCTTSSIFDLVKVTAWDYMLIHQPGGLCYYCYNKGCGIKK